MTSFALPGRFARLVKIEHTLFALPFAYVGALLCQQQVPSASDLIWITIAMVGARSLAMALNRVVDAEIDGRNPRTASREIPSGQLTKAQVWLFCLLSLAVFLVAVWQLDPIVRLLWPIPVAGFVIYPYLKRVTWLSHLWLGAVDGLAPVGGWVAITGKMPWESWALGGAVACWVAGFDLFYALLDADFDRAQRLHSIPARFGTHGAFHGARFLHAATVILLIAAGQGAPPHDRVLARSRRRRGAPARRAPDHPPGRPAAPQRGLLHHERRDQLGLPRLRARRGGDVIHARGLSRRFGRKRVLDGVDLDLPESGFLLVTGPNGSGKTTLLRLCAGLLVPTGGSLEIAAERGEIGYLGHDPLVYRGLTALENLELYGRLYRVPERRERSGMLLERFGLWEVRNDRAGSYSRGMLQRLSLCRALLHEPRLLLLDEPFNALDAAGAELLQRELAERRGATVVATHDPDRVSELATTRLAFA